MLSLLVAAPLQATTYYLSPSGNDNASGTSASQAWRTIDRLSQVFFSLQVGDRILLQRGGVYRGHIEVYQGGTSSQPLTIGAYGTGADPVIDGATTVTGWTQYQGNIWRASLSQAPDQVCLNGGLMTLARFPNNGWLWCDGGGIDHLSDAALNQANGYWNGAEVVVRSTFWSYSKSTIQSHANGTLQFQPIWYDLDDFEWGYFLRNKLSELDAPGEWYYDPTNGYLYLWAPGNANPNNALVEASVRDRGVTVHWQRQHVRIENVEFRHHRQASIFNDGGIDMVVANCRFDLTRQAVDSYGFGSQYLGNVVTRTFGTAFDLVETGALFENNLLQDIGMYVGLGESDWGYMGLRIAGTGNVIRGNVLENIGYIGIAADDDALIERNVVRNATAILNDGAGISFDHADGMVVRNNIVMDCVGDITSQAADHYLYEAANHGIYFGNTSIKNTLVQSNTVFNCSAAGVHVDHTMVSSGNQVRDNVLFDNRIQLSISDFSNYHGPGAVAPYYVASFNGVYSGNTLYSVDKDQFCMRLMNVYGSTPVDFGTFTNNRYHSPYNELSIYEYNVFDGLHHYFTLARWQSERNEDAGSSVSPLHMNDVATVAELGPDLALGGDFTNGIGQWGGWPANATATHSTDRLDNGCLRAELPNASQNPTFSLRNPDWFQVQNGSWYRMRFSIESDVFGNVEAGVKGQSQLNLPVEIYERTFPFGPQRRDVEFYFQSDMTDQGLVQFVNRHTEPRYWLDNVELHRVSVEPRDPHDHHVLLYNDSDGAASLPLPAGCWMSVDGQQVTGSVSLQPFASQVFYRVDGAGCGTGTGGGVQVKVMLGGAMNWGAGRMRADLNSQGMVPATEPYSGLGLAPTGTTDNASPSLFVATGDQAIVDWVLVELHDDDAGHTLLERVAALVQANGQVVTPTGGTSIPFQISPAGHHVVVKHRNHLSVMTAQPVTQDGALIDFSDPGFAVHGSEPAQVQGTKRALWCGDENADGNVRYSGTANDRDPILVHIGGTVPTNVVQGYVGADVNMDGWVKYIGPGNDRDFVLQAVGGSVPTSTRAVQLP
ncbi:MAG: right-handed parallel beta-helix repeat-containing protein [Flavobacteriales bacterium]|nr:right-handed parallel beta-helix repeat-containing protein [Flavobacteriales bacterium]